MKGEFIVRFIDKIKEKAKNNKKTIVLPESLEKRTLEAAHRILEENIAKLILIGNENEINNVGNGLNLEKATIIDPNNFKQMDDYVQTLYDLRKNKGMTQEQAREILISNPLYLGVMMVKIGMADGMVAGAVNSTANVLRPSLQILKTAKGTKLVSSFFVMVVPDCEYGSNGTFIFSDAGLVPNPNSEELAAIAESSAKSFKDLVEEEPYVAMLSFSTQGSGSHPDVEKVVQATQLVKEQNPMLMIDGEFQLDAAIVPSVGAQKAPNSDIAGKANVLIFPDLDAGNIGYKLTQRLAKAEAYGPVTQGIAKPVNDLSRGCTAEDIVGVVAITAVQAKNIS